MEIFLGILGLITGLWVIGKFRSHQHVLQGEVLHEGRLRHLRSGEYPSTCSWCKNTVLARKLFVFENREGWKAADVMALLSMCPPQDVEYLSSTLVTDQPRWRRLCTEKCTREFLTSEHVAAIEPFVSCGYCSCRIPSEMQRCNHCGAPRK
jgi:hypothetical protein